MASMFMKMDGVEGESQQAGYEGWIELTDFSMSSSAPPSTSVGGGSSVEKPTIHGVSVGTVAGKHTPPILAKYFAGQHFANVAIVFLKQTGGATAEKYYQLDMTYAFVTSIANAKGEGSLGSESITLMAETYKQEYFIQGADGILTSVGSSQYNSKTTEVQ